jgi:hypothetical protein
MDVAITVVSARFFLALAVGLLASLLVIDRAKIGPGFLRLMALFALGCLLPAVLLGDRSASFTSIASGVFGLGLLVLIGGAGRFSTRMQSNLLWFTSLAGAAAVSGLLCTQVSSESTATLAFFALGGLNSAMILGMVTGAMILGHWYLVTPDLPVSHLARMTRLALWFLYAKAALLVVTFSLFEGPAGALSGLGAVVGLSDVSTASFQSQLDLIYLLARFFIGLVGPAVLCHMTMETIRLKATQPATGILYAATVMVLMGELFAFLGESSFAVVL